MVCVECIWHSRFCFKAQLTRLICVTFTIWFICKFFSTSLHFSWQLAPAVTPLTRIAHTALCSAARRRVRRRDLKLIARCRTRTGRSREEDVKHVDDGATEVGVCSLTAELWALQLGAVWAQGLEARPFWGRPVPPFGFVIALLALL